MAKEIVHIQLSKTTAEHRLETAGEYQTRLEAKAALVGELVAALKEISLGKGRFSLDPFRHARNTIEDMKELAQAAIAKAEVLVGTGGKEHGS